MRVIKITPIICLFIAVMIGTASCNRAKINKLDKQPALIPMPNSIEWQSNKAYTFGSHNTISIPKDVTNRELLAEQFNATLEAHNLPALALTINDEGASVAIFIDSDLEPDSYVIESTSAYGVNISAGSSESVGYAIQTLRQLVTDKGIAEVNIKDSPRMNYRGVMLDVSRHYMSIDFIKQLLDEMQYYKLNRFHWHLVDAAGWRLEIKQYPQLTEKTAYRTESDWQKWWIEKDRRYATKDTPGAYGGFYTQDEAREIVAYAAERGITVIPEIEIPGHSEEVLATFPQLSCSGKALPHESDFCIGNEESYTFLKNILSEVMQIFPSEYIHIGGDEASKAAWGTCPKCRRLMRQMGYRHIDQLQSHIIHAMEEYLNDNSRQIIGWDEILDGGLAPNATVMSWRGETGGIKAAKSGHNVIMVPNSHLYLDYYQEDPIKSERKQIGGYIPLEKVYSYDPLPKELTEEEQQYIYGVQGNLWTEYILDEDHAAYMLFPRVLALSEVAWTNPELKNWESFRERVNRHIPLLQERGINSYPLSTYLNVTHTVDYDQRRFAVQMSTELYPHEIHYRTDGGVPTTSDPLYIEGDTIFLTDSATLVAGIFRDGQLIGEPTIQRLDYHKGIGHQIKWLTPIGGGYPAGGIETALLDGLRGSITYMDGRWLGNASSQSTIGVIDLGEPAMIESVSTKCMHDIDPWVHMPEWVELSVSTDGKKFETVERILSKTDPKDIRLRFETFTFRPQVTAQYLKIEYHLPLKDKFLFTDEIVIW